jgi:hypothetical protein
VLSLHKRLSLYSQLADLALFTKPFALPRTVTIQAFQNIAFLNKRPCRGPSSSAITKQLAISAGPVFSVKLVMLVQEPRGPFFRSGQGRYPWLVISQFMDQASLTALIRGTKLLYAAPDRTRILQPGPCAAF